MFQLALPLRRQGHTYGQTLHEVFSCPLGNPRPGMRLAMTQIWAIGRNAAHALTMRGEKNLSHTQPVRLSCVGAIISVLGERGGSHALKS